MPAANSETSPIIERSAGIHGDWHLDGLTVDEVVPDCAGAADAVREIAPELSLATSATSTSQSDITAKLSSLHHTATIAFDVLQGGRVGLNGATGALLGRCLREMGDLIRHSR